MKDKRLYCEKSYWERYKELYGENSMGYKFHKWLEKITKRNKRRNKK